MSRVIEEDFPDYFERKLGKNLIAFVARAEERPAAAAYLLVIEKPANPFRMNEFCRRGIQCIRREKIQG